jgi:aconitate hydratase
MAAGLLAKNAVEKGMKVPSFVKTSLAPGSKVVTDYLIKSGLMSYLEKLGFYTVGYGCTTCIGNSGPLSEPITKAITTHELIVSSVLSGNRNFEGRVHPHVRANWLASPPLVVAFALAGSTTKDLSKDPVGLDDKGQPVYLKDIWPSNQDIQTTLQMISQSMYQKEYSDVFKGDDAWQTIPVTKSATYEWDSHSTYIQHPPYFEELPTIPQAIEPIQKANILALFGDSITTDHISPAGSIKLTSPAGHYLKSHHVEEYDFNSYGARRGNHEVMMRGTFANIRIKNEMTLGIEGGVTRYLPTNEIMSIYDAAMRYKESNTPLVIFAGKEYGTGSSRDWAAKGTNLLGVKAVIAESFERIHRSNLVGMGILPLQFMNGITRQSLGLTGDEIIDIPIHDSLTISTPISIQITYPNGEKKNCDMLVRIDTKNELTYFKNGGILQFMLRNMS